jgi:hypothetical protein
VRGLEGCPPPKLRSTQNQKSFIDSVHQRDVIAVLLFAMIENKSSLETAETSKNGQKCPCCDLCSIESIYNVLESEEQSRRLILWLSGEISTCATRNDCNVRRVSASFSIINAIREACNPHLEAGNDKRSSPKINRISPKPSPEIYEESFPSLQSKSSNNSKIISTSGQRQQQQQQQAPTNKLNAKKKKKRIRPVAAAAPASGTTGAWGNIASLPPQKPIEMPTQSLSTKNVSATRAWTDIASLKLSQQPSEILAQPRKNSNTPAEAAGVWGNISNFPSQSTTHRSPQGKKTTSISQKPTVMSVEISSQKPTPGAWGNKLNAPAGHSAVPIPLDPKTKNMSTQQQVASPKRKNSNFPHFAQPSGTNESIHATQQPARAQQVTPDVEAAFTTPSKDKTSSPNMTVSSIEPLESRLTSPATPKKMFVTPYSKNSNTAGQISTETVPTQSTSARVQSTPIKAEVIPASKDQVDRFVEIYCTLIFHNLVPSTALELHLLLRLLNIDEPKNLASKVPETNFNQSTIIQEETKLDPIFPDAAGCRFFAAQVLSKLSFLLKPLGMPFLQDLVKSSSFQNHLPEVTADLENEIKKQAATGALLTIDHSSMGSTALLTLPFQSERDSRHNYRTRDELVLYKNREESRDAFLYQLRSFLNIRGKVLDTVQAQRSIQRIRSSARVVVEGVMTGNMPWFAQFFCELLLQVGLVPIEETDKDLLNIADKDKLQVSLSPLYSAV